ECVTRSCTKQLGACAADATCSRAATCMGACSDPGCVMTQCAGAYRPRNDRLVALVDCAKESCTEPCEIGSSWRCIGKYDWPTPAAEPFSLPFELTLFQDNSPLTKMAVRACAGGTDCLGPNLLGSTMTTDDSQHGTIQVKPLTGLSRPYFPESWDLR